MVTKPWLWLPPIVAHKLLSVFLWLRFLFFPPQKISFTQKKWRHLIFSNPMGIAGGVDKNAQHVNAWWTLGLGFIEVGTLTPRPQNPNPGKILLRDNKNLSLWNKMGFPNEGLEALKKRLKKIKQPHFTPIFVNIGKNRSTSNSEAHKDYIECIEALSGLADAFVINISSPNTKSLRNLFENDAFEKFLAPIVFRNKELGQKNVSASHTPLLLKLSPDLETSELKKILDTSCRLNMDGFIISNTTTRNTNPLFLKEGGVSGKSLRPRALEQLKQVLSILGPRRQQKLIVSCGGVLTADDILQRLSLGADLVQVYSALVFHGPFFFKNSLTTLKRNAISHSP